MASNGNKFSSEGFDLSALQDASNDVVLELGGGTSTSNTTANASTTSTVMATAESWKQKGNEAFKEHDWEVALENYTKAIDATPGSPTGPELLQLKDEWDKEQHKLVREQLDRDEAARRRDPTNVGSESATGLEEKDKPRFQPPPHTYGAQLAVYYNNRAACSLQLANELEKNDFLEKAVEDCTIATWLNPSYTKAWVRRATAYERMEKTDLALADLKQAIKMEPSNKSIQAALKRVEKLEQERMEKLKEETMGKLKELGNSILGNFGLSLDNFKAEQDPNTGSYNISFSQDNK